MPSPQMLGSNRVALPPQVVMTNRVIWAALLLGQLMFIVVIAVVGNSGEQRSPTSAPVGIFMIVDAALLAAAIAATGFVKSYGYRGVQSEQGLRGRYALSLILPMAFLEGASFFGLVVVFITRHWVPAIIVPGIAMAIQLTLFPRGSVSVASDFRSETLATE